MSTPYDNTPQTRAEKLQQAGNLLTA